METTIKTAIITATLIFNTPYVAHYERPPDPAPAPDHYVLLAEITKYSSEEAQTDDTPLITASGDNVSRGTIACPARLEFGTKVEIQGKIYHCNDRMASKYRKGNYFDVWTPSKDDAIAWGRRKVSIKIYD